MRLFLLTVLAGVVSIAAGIGVVILTSHVLPPYDAAGRGLGGVNRLAPVATYGFIVMVVLGCTARGERAFRIAMLALLIAPACVMLFGVLLGVIRRPDLYALQQLLFWAIQALLPLWAVVVAQWFILRWGVNSRKVAG